MTNATGGDTTGTNTGRYGAQSSLLALIYGITHEIWEERGVELCRRYYAEDVDLFALGGVSHGVDAIVDGTYDTLRAFPDRRLLAENVVWSADADGDYSSHRILSPMTNLEATVWGEATGTAVQVRTVADCLVRDGRVVREWLMRDNLSLVQQLGFDPVTSARQQAATVSYATRQWWMRETERVRTAAGTAGDVDHPDAGFARQALAAAWLDGTESAMAAVYPHYAVGYPTPLTVLSGRTAIAQHYAELRSAFSVDGLTVDHIAAQPWGHEGRELAVRWSLLARHTGSYLGLPATDQPTYLLGTSHWRLIEGRVATEWTVFDGMGILAQLV